MSEEHYAELIDLLEREDALTPVFQPVVDLATGRLAGYEALSRFNAEVPRPPDQWFAHAHRCGLGPALEAKAVRAALASPDRPAGMFLCLNVSPSALASAEVREALPEDLTGLVIEITEQELFHDVERLNSLLVEMRARGARIALDDAGAGYAGLQAMMRVELDIIKLDRSLVDGIHSDLAKVALLESVVRFARRMGATVCAEGIETIEDLMVVADLDVTYGQGWVLARPAEPWVSLAPSVSQTLLRRSVRSHGEASGGPGMPENGARRLEQLTARLSNVRSTEDLATAWELVTAELGADEICFSTWHPDRGCVETLSEHDWMTVGETFAVAEYPGTRHVLETQEAAQVVAGDPEADPAEVELLTQGGYRSLLMVPVVHRGETVGLLEGYRTEERPWARSDINRARIIGYQLGAVLEGLPRSAPRSPAQVVHLESRRQTA